MRENSYGVVPLRQLEGVWEVLLVQNLHGRHWGFPKGKPEGQEDSLASASRELFEETGLTIKTLVTKEPLIEEYSFIREGKTVEKSVTYYLALCSGTLSLQKEELLAFKWLSLEQAERQLSFPGAKKIVQKSREFLKQWRPT